MLAKIANDDAGCLILCGVLRFFASKLAPTVQVLRYSSAQILRRIDKSTAFTSLVIAPMEM